MFTELRFFSSRDNLLRTPVSLTFKACALGTAAIMSTYCCKTTVTTPRWASTSSRHTLSSYLRHCSPPLWWCPAASQKRFQKRQFSGSLHCSSLVPAAVRRPYGGERWHSVEDQLYWTPKNYFKITESILLRILQVQLRHSLYKRTQRAEAVQQFAFLKVTGHRGTGPW